MIEVLTSVAGTVLAHLITTWMTDRRWHRGGHWN